MTRCTTEDSATHGEVSTSSKRRKVEELDYDSAHLISPTKLRARRQSHPHRHEKLWFSDGSVVLVADGMSFKLHAGILEHHSVVFKNILSHSRRASQEILDGCRVLYVTDDGFSLGELLLILYDGGSSVFFNRKVPIAFARLRTLTLLAAKYKIRHVVAEATERLEVIFPVRFEDKRVEWNAFYTVVEDTPISALTVGDCVPAVCLARAINPTNPPAFIVMAFYFCCQLELAYPTDGADDIAALSARDLRACLAGVEALLTSNKDVKNSIFEFLGDTACASKGCRLARGRMIRSCALAGHFSSTAPLDRMQYWSESTPVAARGTLCGLCDQKLRVMYDGRRVAAFNKLGKVFGIPGWPVPKE